MKSWTLLCSYCYYGSAWCDYVPVLLITTDSIARRCQRLPDVARGDLIRTGRVMVARISQDALANSPARQVATEDRRTIQIHALACACTGAFYTSQESKLELSVALCVCVRACVHAALHRGLESTHGGPHSRLSISTKLRHW